MSLSKEHLEIDLLLPWYVNETLSDEEHQRVAAHVSSCAECRESISLLTDVQSAVAKNKATPIVPQPRVDDLLDSIERRSPLRRFGKRRAVHYLAGAVATAILVLTLISSSPDMPAEDPRWFVPATSLVPVSMDYVLRIRFGAATTDSARERVLQDIGARDISGGNAEGTYRVIVRLSATSLEELERYTDSLESLPEVTSVDVVALQLPMKAEP